MRNKVVIIGGGSSQWTPRLAQDLFLRSGLAGSELVLVDIDQEALELLTRYCEALIKRCQADWTVRAAELDDALRDASLVCVSISTGDVEAMHWDYTIPEEFGVYHTVADTVGPGGTSRTLRNVPVFLDIARRMERLCPDAWMVHVTNPLNQLTSVVARETAIKVAGLCHNYAGTVRFLASFFDCAQEEVEAVSVGVNHGTWMKDLTVRGKPVRPDDLTVEKYLRFEAEKQDVLVTNTTDDDIEAMFAEDQTLHYLLGVELFQQFGYFPVGGAPHVAENFPYYLNHPEVIARHRIRRKGVLPVRRENKNRKRQEIVDRLNGRAEWPELTISAEGLSNVAESLYTGKVSRVMATMLNQGQITNLPADTPVETWAVADRNGLTPVTSGPVPEALLGMMQGVCSEIELSVQAAVTGDRKLATQAVYISPMLQDKDKAAELTERLIEAQKEFLPQFF